MLRKLFVKFSIIYAVKNFLLFRQLVYLSLFEIDFLKSNEYRETQFHTLYIGLKMQWCVLVSLYVQSLNNIGSVKSLQRINFPFNFLCLRWHIQFKWMSCTTDTRESNIIFIFQKVNKTSYEDERLV